MTPTYDPTPREDKREDDRLAGIERRAFDNGAEVMRHLVLDMLVRDMPNTYDRNLLDLRILALKVENLKGRP